MKSHIHVDSFLVLTLCLIIVWLINTRGAMFQILVSRLYLHVTWVEFYVLSELNEYRTNLFHSYGRQQMLEIFIRAFVVRTHYLCQDCIGNYLLLVKYSC